MQEQKSNVLVREYRGMAAHWGFRCKGYCHQTGKFHKKLTGEQEYAQDSTVLAEEGYAITSVVGDATRGAGAAGCMTLGLFSLFRKKRQFVVTYQRD